MDVPFLFRNELSLRPKRTAAGFTLIELLVASAILLIIFGVLAYLIEVSSSALKTSTAEVQSFQAARNAFESMTRNIALATLNNYYDYTDGGVTLASYPASSTTPFQPTGYQLTSDLHFISGSNLLTTPAQVTHAIFFQAPLGYSSNSQAGTLGTYSTLDNMLNACGYFIEYNQVPAPSFVPNPTVHSRYQLMEFIQPTENLTVYSTSAGTNPNGWFTTDIANPASTDVHPLASNIIALVIEPRSSSADSSTTTSSTNPAALVSSGYAYDSRNGSLPAQINQLPPVVQIVMVAIDEASALKLGDAVMQQEVQGALSGLFATTDSTQLKTDQDLEGDLQTLETRLTGYKINYAVFQTQVALRSAKLVLP